MITLYRKKVFSTRACRWYPDTFFHRRRPSVLTLLIVRSRARDRRPRRGHVDRNIIASSETLTNKARGRRFDTVPRIKLHDKMKALELLCRYFKAGR